MQKAPNSATKNGTKIVSDNFEIDFSALILGRRGLETDLGRYGLVLAASENWKFLALTVIEL